MKIEIDPRDWTRCAKCDMRVENFYVYVQNDAIEFVAECHGDQERTFIPDSDWDFVTKVEFGASFERGFDEK